MLKVYYKRVDVNNYFDEIRTIDEKIITKPIYDKKLLVAIRINLDIVKELFFYARMLLKQNSIRIRISWNAEKLTKHTTLF